MLVTFFSRDFAWLIAKPPDKEIIDLANVLCNPVGGEIVKAPNGSYVLPGTEGTPTPVAFTGDASTGLVGSFGWGAMTLVVMLGGLAFAGDLL